MYVDTVAVLSGEEAAAALAANPVYPVAGEITMAPASENAREIVASDHAALEEAMGTVVGLYIIPDEEITFVVTIDETCDPDADILYSDCLLGEGAFVLLRDALAEDGTYQLTTACDSMEVTGYSYTDFYLITDGMETMRDILFFASEENANAFFAMLSEEMGAAITWTYADGTLPSTDAVAEASEDAAAEAEYRIVYTDQDGNPVPGVTVQVCDEATCVLYTTDENGVVTFTGAPYAWEIHTLRLPEGYEGDTQTVTTAPVEGGEVQITVTKN